MIIDAHKLFSPILLKLSDPLLRNSIYLMMNSVLGIVSGFIFWIIAAKIYSKEDVGIATALISAMSLIVLISRLGLNFSIIRYAPNSNTSEIFNTSAIITTILANTIGIAFIIGIDIFSPGLSLLKSPINALIFLIVLSASSVASLSAVEFVAIRKANLQFFQGLIDSSRILFLIPLLAFNSIGIFSSLGISMLLDLAGCLYFLRNSGIVPSFVLDWSFIRNAFNFSTSNYLVSLFMTAPNMILSIVILETLGAEKAAYFYMAFSIASSLQIIPTAVGISLFVEGSHGEDMKKIVIASLKGILSLFIPLALFFFFFGGSLLAFVGKGYADFGIPLLRLLIISNLFGCVNFVYFAVKRVQKDLNSVVILSGITSLLLVGLSYQFSIMFGLIGIGYAWLLTHVLVATLVVYMSLRERII